MHFVVSMRPDIAFAVSTIAQFSSDSGLTHWEAVKRIYHYILGTKNLGLTFGNSKQGLEGFTNAMVSHKNTDM